MDCMSTIAGRWQPLLTPLLTLALAAPLAAQSAFPYEVHKRTLANGLDVIAIPMPEFKDVLSYNTLVLVGSRNEVEPGKSGLAHLFEHILFRHRWEGRVGGYEAAMRDMGAFNNAFTTADITYYHPLTFTSNLDELARLSANQFVRLDYTEEIFKTEAGAVFGEYRRNATNPGLRMSEVRGQLSHGDHGYGHTTIGYLDDVEDMPNEYEAAVRFYSDWYRPNNIVLIVSGDIKPERVFGLAEELYGEWENAPVPELRDPPPVGGPKREHVDWPADVPPRVQVSYRMPAHRNGTVETAVGQLLPELLTGETAPLYQKLRFEKQTAARLFSGTRQFESFDAGTMSITAVMFKNQYEERGTQVLDETIVDIEQGLEDLKSFASRPDAAETLEALKRKYAYDVLALFSSPANVAQNFAWYYRFERDPDVFDRLVESVRRLTPEDVERFARTHFNPENEVVVTMTPAAAPVP